MKKKIIGLAAAALLAACGGKGRPADVMAPGAMVEFLSDAYLLEGFYAIETQHRYDSLLPEVLAAYDDLLERHHLTREAVERSFDYYMEHPDDYRAIQDSVVAYLDATNGGPGVDTLDISVLGLESDL